MTDQEIAETCRRAAEWLAVAADPGRFNRLLPETERMDEADIAEYYLSLAAVEIAEMRGKHEAQKNEKRGQDAGLAGQAHGGLSGAD